MRDLARSGVAKSLRKPSPTKAKSYQSQVLLKLKSC